ncbi:hypothetical protein ACFW04_003931 [Cataglyphis niger]
MSAFLQFNCLIHDEHARKAIESYVGILQEAFQQYQNLWENYIKLQKKYEQCNVHSSSQMKIDKPCTEIKDEPISQRQLNNSTITQEESISLLELDTFNIDSVNLKSNTGAKSPPRPRESPCKDTDIESPSKSPVFARKDLRTGGISVKKFVCSPEAVSINNNLTSDMKTHCSSEKVSSKYNQKLEISTSQHVETTFLPNGKRLKQSRLVFHPIKCNEKIVSLSVQNKPASILPKVEQESIQDISIVKASVATENNAADINETFEDVIEISPTQRNITSKVTNRLRLKRKTFAKQTIKSSSSKYKDYDSVSSIAPKIMIDTIDFALCSSPEHTSIGMEDDKLLVGNMTNTVVNALKDKVNVSNLSPIKMCNEINVQIKKEDQVITNKVQVAEKNNGFIYEDESFHLPDKLAVNKNDTNDFHLDDTENKPPVKKTSLTKFNVLQRKENISEQINMRCKADRAKLNGWDCWECEEYYKNLLLSKDELQKRKNQCSRHRHKYERPSTPEGFWDPEFPETLSSTYRQNKT